jgi:hypothetical protein
LIARFEQKGSLMWRRVPFVLCFVLGTLFTSPAAFASGNLNWGSGVEASLPGAPTSSFGGLTSRSLSCPSAGNCTAVSDFTDGSGNQQGLLLTETAGTWAPGVEAPLPDNAASNPNVMLNAVSCASAGDCTAVGSYRDSSGTAQGLVLTETAGVWSTGVEAALPAGAASTFQDAFLVAVSCASPGNCTAVGRYNDSNLAWQGLLVSETDGTWSAGVEAPLPDDPTPTSDAQRAFVDSVSCPSAGNCAAVGYYTDSANHHQGVLLSQANGVWAGVEASLPPAAADPHVGIGSVSCTSVGNCTAVGGYLPTPGQQSVLFTETSGTWATGVTAPVPPGQSSDWVNVDSVSCTSAGTCAAVGWYRDSSGAFQGLLLSERAGTWAAGVEATLPSNAIGTNVDVKSVSCPSADNCRAVGYYRDSASHDQGLLLTETDGVWAPGIEASLPAGAATDPVAGLFSVSCPSVGKCSAAGSYASSANREGVLLDASPAPPTASISSPTSGRIYTLGQAAPTSFSCQEGTGGSGLTSCHDSTGTSTTSIGRGHLNTAAPGSHTYTVTATSNDSLSGCAHLTYMVVAANGSGKLITPTASVARGARYRTIRFTYTVSREGIVGGELALTVPRGWSLPSTSHTARGFVTTSAGRVSVFGREITVSGLTRAAGQTIKIAYGAKISGGPGANAPTMPVGPQTWHASDKSTASGTLKQLAASPRITIT